MSAISVANNFLPRKLWITTKRSVVKAKVINPVPVKWVFKRKEDPDRLIILKYRNVVKGYMHIPGVDVTESFLSVTSDTLTSILIGMTLYHKYDVWVSDICDWEVALLKHNTEVEMFI